MRYVRALGRLLERLAQGTTEWVGSSWAFVVAALLTATWLLTGSLFRYSDTWQLVMNTVSSIVTFLMVFLLQRSQNKEFMALQLKLDELIAAKKGASNRLINAEDLSEDQVRELHEHFHKLYEDMQRQGKLLAPTTIERTEEHAPAGAASAGDRDSAVRSG
jgi:low affinity Fe/Cu permease